MRPRTHRTIPDAPSGYPLDNQFAVVVPIARTNLVTNPSFETDLTNWSASGFSSIARVATEQYHGAYSLQVTPTSATTDGAFYNAISMVAGSTYAASAKVKAAKGVKYQIAVYSAGGTRLASSEFIATGRWQWVYTYYTETSSNLRKITIGKVNSPSTTLFYIDGVQVESITAGETVSTYIDGDQLGLVPNQSPPAYYWNGTPHASTSNRSGLTRAGGMVMPLSKYRFLLTAIIGLGLATPQNVATEYARLDGAYPDYTRKPTRQFSLAGSFQATGYTQLRDARGQLGRVLDRDQSSLDQPLLLRHTLGDSEAAIVPAKYTGGLGGNTDNQYAETTAISLTQYLPFIVSEREAGASLTVQQSVTNANYIVQRSAAGVWSALSTGITGSSVRALARTNDGAIYAGGVFTDAGGSGADYIAKWTPATSTWSVLNSATSINTWVLALAVAPNGTTVYVGGVFTNADGNANADYIASWNSATSTWSALGTGMNGNVNALAVAPDATLFAGGDFTDAGGSGADYLAKWNGSAWSVVGSATSLNASVFAIATSGSAVYVGGDFTNADGNADADRIAVWNTATSTWSALGTGMNGTVRALQVLPDGSLYAVGAFTTAGGVTVNGAAVWNGSSWQGLGSGISGTLGGDTIAPDPQGKVIISADATTTFGGVVMPDRVARWNGATWLPIDIDLPGVGTIVRAMLTAPDGTFYMGFDANGTATSAAITTVTNPGTARSYPALTIKGPTSGTSRIYQLINYTTGRAIYLNYTINAGETARMVFEPDRLSFTSNFAGNLASKIMPGSAEADFFLQPGANNISFYAADSSVVATLTWHPQFVSLDDIPQ